MPTDSFTSSANAIAGTSATFMATDSFTSSAAGVSSASQTFTNALVGSSVFTRQGFQVRVTPAGVTCSKASTFGGAQANLAFPLSKSNARELAEALLELTG